MNDAKQKDKEEGTAHNTEESFLKIDTNYVISSVAVARMDMNERE
jgi:hypothetical protein